MRERPALVPRLGDLALLVPGTRTLTAAERSRRDALLRAAGRDMEAFLWGKPAFSSTVAALFAETTPGRNFDYEFWIHMAVLWLFEKHTRGRSWADTIRAYNGSGAGAAHYRQAIVRRTAAAATASAHGREFVPEGI